MEVTTTEKECHINNKANIQKKPDDGVLFVLKSKEQHTRCSKGVGCTSGKLSQISLVCLWCIHMCTDAIFKNV
ncbi:hypothetical protein L484_027113 [Morus notabilis]|uniref:Uncharacterized protein n=1 Tax=Morus notabilis TaxID=981085 RepID=W9S0Y4_9ROSA|nr:hypothetical protein L484_027113 [Morus notabilis]